MNFIKGDLILYEDKSFFGQITRFITGGKYVHAEIIGDGFSFCVNEKGIFKKPFSQIKGEFDIFRPIYKDLDKAIAYAYKELKDIKGYAFLNLLAFTFIRLLRFFNCQIFQNSKYKICSEFCADVMDKGSVKSKKRDYPNSLLSPSDLYYFYDIY